MILEMPDSSDNDPFQSWEKIGEYIKSEKLRLKFMTATHNHSDHFSTHPQFHKRFPDIPIVVNPYFFRKRSLIEFISAEDLESGYNQEPSTIHKGVPICCFKGELFETHLGGEPLYLIQAPKHSWSDTLIVFRGTMITGDWWLGPGDPNPSQIPVEVINRSIDRVENFCRERRYQINTMMSVHANEFRSNFKFFKLMEETRP